MLADKRRLAWLALLGLVAANAFLAYSLTSARTGRLTVSFLDVGKGDAIFIEGPTGVRVLIDGGPDASILRALGAELNPFERRLHAVIETHPGAESIGGLVDVFEKYQVDAFFSSETSKYSSASDALAVSIASQKIKSTALTRGTKLDLGGGAYIKVLSPDRDASGLDADTGSLVLRVVYGSSSFLVPGAAPVGVESYLAGLDGPSLKSDVLLLTDKRKNATTSPEFLAAVAPAYRITSATRFVSDGTSLEFK
jgi:beta-lactamase superfamily II metal-dependent hydrolase